MAQRTTARSTRRRLASAILGIWVAAAILSVGPSATPAAAADPVVTFPTQGATVPGNGFTATGTSDVNETIQVFMNLNPDPICVIPGQAGVWGWECTIDGLSRGAQTLTVTQLTSNDVVVNFQLEGTILTVDYPADGQRVYGEPAAFRGAGDTGDGIFVEVDDQFWCETSAPPLGEQWSCSGGEQLFPGLHSYEVFQFDQLVTGQFEIVYDLPPPGVEPPGPGRVTSPSPSASSPSRRCSRPS